MIAEGVANEQPKAFVPNGIGELNSCSDGGSKAGGCLNAVKHATRKDFSKRAQAALPAFIEWPVPETAPWRYARINGQAPRHLEH